MTAVSPESSSHATFIATSELAKQYRPVEHEAKVWETWEEKRAFHADPSRVNSGQAKPYCVLIPPPNVTAALHLGHALNNTLQDILVRQHRMLGYEALWMPGTDHAGIATQAVVEKRVMKEEKKRRTDFSREDFIAKIQVFKDEYEATITNQLKKMGCSCDWDRQRFTMDDICAGAVREAFFRLFTDGVIYRGKRLVNWDPALQTAVADDECYDEEINGAFYYLRYPVVTPAGEAVAWDELCSRGYPAAEHNNGTAWITVATTRPETYLGDSAVALNPSDPRAASLRGLCVKLPLVDRIIPIIEDTYVVLPEVYARTDEERNDPKAKMATGFLKVTPAHDPNDWEIGRRHNLAVINMMSPDGRVSAAHGWTDTGSAGALLGKKMAEARTLVVEAFKERGLLEGSKPHVHSVKHSDRSKAVIEPYLSNQWYVRVTDARMAAAANETLQNEEGTDLGLRFYPARYAKTFEHWHENIRDWCISRQLWWGHRIPVWRKDFSGGQSGHLEALDGWAASGRIACRDGAGRPGPAGISTDMAAASGEDSNFYVCVRNPEGVDREIVTYLESKGFTRDEDVLDTWFSSALWPISTMGWPAPDARTAGLLEAFNPSSTLCTAREIITLWVSRMTMFNRYFMGSGKGRGPVPFHKVFVHAVIQDGEGRKMSKSLGNGVDPLDIIESHGADAMRFTLCNMATDTQDVRMPVVKDSKSGKNSSTKFDLGRNFANKVWNAARFTLGLVHSTPQPADVQAVHIITPQSDLASAWMLARLHAAVQRIDAALKDFAFAEYAQALYDIVWRDFCDWYLEAIKPTVATNPAQRDALVNITSAILRLLHPVMPFMTESLWTYVSQIKAGSISGLSFGASRPHGLLCGAGWPVVNETLQSSHALAEFDHMQSLVTAIREARAGRGVSPKHKITLYVPASHAEFFTRNDLLMRTFCMLGDIRPAAALATAPPGGTLTVTIDAAPFVLADFGDPQASGEEGAAGGLAESERTLLLKRKADLEKEIKTYTGRLESPGYAQKAPPHMVQETQDKLDKAKAELAAIQARGVA